jgi:hypothetical protein
MTLSRERVKILRVDELEIRRQFELAYTKKHLRKATYTVFLVHSISYNTGHVFLITDEEMA